MAGAVPIPMGPGSLARALLVTSGRAVATRALPLVIVVGIVSTIVFAGNGLRARDAVAIVHGTLGVRAVLWAAWMALATPAIAPAFDAPGTRTLRSLRPPRVLVGMLVALVAIAQAPWIVLFARGGGALEGVAVALVASAACASAVAAWRSQVARVAFAATWALVLVDPRPLVAIALGAPLAWIATHAAWGSALEERGAWRIVRPAPAAIALASAYLARMVRVARMRLQAAAWLALAGGGALALTLRNDPDARPVSRALLVFALPLSAAAAILAAPALETEARMTPILRVTRTSRFTLALAMILALATPSTAFAATAGAAAAYASHTTALVPLAGACWALAIASVIALWARRAAHARRPSTFVVGAAAIGVLFTAMAAAC